MTKPLRRSPRLRQVAVALFAFCLLAAGAPVGATEHEAGIWAIVSSAGHLPLSDDDSRWRYTVDSQYRWVDDAAGFRQYLLRPALGYALANGVQLWFGYGRFNTEPANGPSNFENRYWQQVNWRVGALGEGTLTARVRTEQRLLSTGDDIAVVARLMLRYSRPLPGAEGRYFALGLEPFIDFRDTDWGARSGVSQNRLTFGIGQPLSEHVSIEAGYMHQHFFREGAEDRSNHLATIHLRVSFR